MKEYRFLFVMTLASEVANQQSPKGTTALFQSQENPGIQDAVGNVPSLSVSSSILFGGQGI